MSNRLGLIVPTLNAGPTWKNWIAAYREQDLKADWVLILDSSSEDGTAFLAREAGFQVVRLPRSQFNHGTTRQLGAQILKDAGLLCYMTQDAVFAQPDSLVRLIDVFQNPMVAAAFGRQLPHKGAGPLEAFPRLFNYPDESAIKGIRDIPRLGIKAAFISNSFAAYRKPALLQVDGFPGNTILGEDTYVAAKMLLQGWNIAYCADAVVHHSHAYSNVQEFRRYFDIGVFHKRESWMLRNFGTAAADGLRYVVAEFAYLSQTSWWLLPAALFRSVAKFCGYRLGLMERLIPKAIKKRLSMHPLFWV